MLSGGADAVSRSTPPALAVVICTFNRSTLLRTALESLAAQTVTPTSFEVIVIDDGSSDDTRRVVESFMARLPVQWVYQRNAGLASAKNHGLFRTRAPLVLFLDDDDVADTRLVEEHLITHQQWPANNDAVLGFTGLQADLAADPLMHFVTEVGCFLFSYPALEDGASLGYSHFWGGRTSCKRAFLLEHGVFNPVFRFGCEDIELGFRLSRHGLRVQYNSRAVSTMVRGMTFEGFIDRLTRQGRSNAVFSRLHPDEEVQRWTEVTGAREAWSTVAATYESIMRSAQALDTMMRRKRAMGFDISHTDIDFLYRAYWSACRASKLKGIIEGLEAGDVGQSGL